MTDIAPHDIVELRDSVGAWPGGTTGTVVDAFPGTVVVEMVSSSGRTLDLLDIPTEAVVLVEAHSSPARGVGA
jgi:hypothetical protein